MKDKLKKYILRPQNQIAFTLGLSILTLAYVSSRVLHIEIPYIYNAVPGLVVLVYEGLVHSKKVDSKYTRTVFWIIAIIVSTAVVILIHM